jgi:hypothetical protein
LAIRRTWRRILAGGNERRVKKGTTGRRLILSREAAQRAAVIGLGGLGHMVLKLGVARGANMTVFTTTPVKLEDARRMGASEAFLWNDADAMRRLTNSFDFTISTVPQAYPVQQFMNLLRLDATLVNVGALENINGLDGKLNGFGRRSFARSMIGGIAETQQVVDYCAAREIIADVEIIRPDQINDAVAASPELVRMSSRPPFTPEPQTGPTNLKRASYVRETIAGSRQSNSPDSCNYATAVTTRPAARLKEL